MTSVSEESFTKKISELEIEMKILTFNAALLEIRLVGRTFFRPIEHIERRLRRMPEFLLDCGADFICMQEVYRKKHKEQLAEGLKSVYPYVTHDPRNYLVGYDSGLMIFSKVPFKSEHTRRFTNQPVEESLFSKKIALAGIFETEGLRIAIINSHATSIGFNFKQDDSRIERIRRRQIEDVIHFAAELRRDHSCDVVLVTGDYNCGPQISPENYQVFEHFEYIDLYSKKHEELTWDPETNVLIQASTVYKNTPGQRVDLIMSDRSIEKHYHGFETQILYRETIVDIGNGQKVPLSDHYGVLTELSRKR